MKTNRRLFLWLAALSPLAPALAMAAPAKPAWYLAPEDVDVQDDIVRCALGFLDLDADDVNEELHHRLRHVHSRLRIRSFTPLSQRLKHSAFALASRLWDRGDLSEAWTDLRLTFDSEPPGIRPLRTGELLKRIHEYA